jgi:hypothetical protein
VTALRARLNRFVTTAPIADATQTVAIDVNVDFIGPPTPSAMAIAVTGKR